MVVSGCHYHDRVSLALQGVISEMVVTGRMRDNDDDLGRDDSG